MTSHTILLNCWVRKENKLVFVFSVLLFSVACSISLFLYDQESENIWLMPVVSSVVLILYYRAHTPILMILAFFFLYLIQPYYYFVKEVDISIYQVYQKAKLVNQIALINNIFLFGLFLGIRRVNLHQFVMRKVFAQQKNRLYYYTFIALFLVGAVIGMSGENMFASAAYGVARQKSTIFEYSIVFFVISMIFVDKSNKVQVALLLFAFFYYTVKSLLFGGRIEIVMLGLSLLYYFNNYFVNNKRHFLILLVISYLGMTAYGTIRSNPIAFFVGEIDLIDLFYGDGNDIQKGYVVSHFADVYYASMRLVGLVQDGFFSYEQRGLSLFLNCCTFPLPAKYLPPEYSIASMYKDHAAFGGGGLISSYFYVWGGVPGVLFSGLLVGLLIRLSHKVTSPAMYIYGLMVFITFPRWMGYNPVILFRLCLFAALIFLVAQFVRRFVFRSDVKVSNA